MPKSSDKTKGAPKRRKDSDKDDTTGPTSKQRKVQKKKSCAPDDGIAMSKQLEGKVRKGRQTRLTRPTAKNNAPRICGNGRPMPSLADLEKMYEDSEYDSDSDQNPNVANDSVPPLRSHTPEGRLPIVPPEKLMSPNILKSIASKVYDILETGNISSLDDDGPPPPVIPQRNPKKPDVPYIVGCKERPQVPEPCSARIGVGDTKYGVLCLCDNEDCDCPKKHRKRGEGAKISKSIFNPKSEQIAAALKENEPKSSDKTKGAQKRRKDSDKDDTTGPTSKQRKVQKKKSFAPDDGIAMSKQLEGKVRKGCQTRLTRPTAKNNAPRICGNGRPMPSLADLEKMYEDSEYDSDSDQNPNVANDSVPPLRSHTPEGRLPIVPPEKLMSPNILKNIASKVYDILETGNISSLDDDGPPPPVIPQRNPKKPDVPYIVGCKERPQVPEPCSARIGVGDTKYGVLCLCDNEDCDCPKKRRKRGEGAKISKSIFNPKSEQSAAALKENEPKSSDKTKGAQKRRKDSDKDDTTGPTSKQRKVQKKKSFAPDDGIAMSKQLEGKVRKGRQTRLTRPTAKNNAPRICGNGRPMPSLADLEKMYEDSEYDSDSDQNPNVANDSVPPLRSQTPEGRLPIVPPEKLMSPNTLKNIATKVDVPYIVGCKERPQVPEPCSARIGVGDTKYGVLCLCDNEDCDCPKKRRKRGEGAKISKSIFNPKSEQIAAALKENERIGRTLLRESPDSCDTVSYEYTDNSPNRIVPRPFSPRPSTSKNNKIIQQNEKLFTESLVCKSMSNNSQSYLDLLDTLMRKFQKKDDESRNVVTLVGPDTVAPSSPLTKDEVVISSSGRAGPVQAISQPNPAVVPNNPPDNIPTITLEDSIPDPQIVPANKKVIQSPSPQRASGRGIECPICMESLSNSSVASTLCGHVFCMECIKAAIRVNGKKCPTCRKPLKGVGYHQLFL